MLLEKASILISMDIPNQGVNITTLLIISRLALILIYIKCIAPYISNNDSVVIFDCFSNQ